MVMSSQTDRRHARRLIFTTALLLIDAGLAWLSMLMAVRWRYDVNVEPLRADIDHRSALIAALVTVIVWVIMRQDRAIWRFTSLADFRRLFIGVIVVMLIVPLTMFLGVDRGENFPRAAPIIAGALFALCLVLTRLMTMVAQNGDFRGLYRSPSFHTKDAILIGAAPNIYNYLRDTTRRPKGLSFNPIGLIETSGQYDGRSIRSVPVLGAPEDLNDLYPKLAARRDRRVHLLSLDPNPDPTLTAQLIKLASNLGAPLARFHRGVGDQLSHFEAADLIGREPRDLDMAPVSELISGKRVLITGAGGSIGSELSEQIARLAPSHLALVDSSELNLFKLERTLRNILPFTHPAPWRTYIADVCNAGRMAEIFEAERPDIVLHAAALKHVPLGERNPVETLRTNVLGTSVTLDMCEVFEVGHFVLISTDKAVDPVNVMGASKRVVELLTLARQSQIPHMHTSAVRFGNVLASTGSVVNLFEEQIAEGGPVTVTHSDMNRYFMTVEEASSLVLQAAALNASQGVDQAHIYVLEMGEPVNITQLAKNLIRLRGKVPDEDIEIVFTGLRPGEKLSERLTHREEMLLPTTVSGVRRFDACVVDPESILRRVDALLEAIERRDRAKIRKALARLLKGYVPKDTLNGLPVMHDLPDMPEVASLKDRSPKRS
ncbi:MAG: nucleoside-diphosphate sugar epimerase/dehydratase [Pseudomonadota bacterium]